MSVRRVARQLIGVRQSWCFCAGSRVRRQDDQEARMVSNIAIRRPKLERGRTNSSVSPKTLFNVDHGTAMTLAYSGILRKGKQAIL